MSNTPRPPQPQPRPVRVKAIYRFTAQLPTELALDPGDEIEVCEMSDIGWTYGRCLASGRSGWFPITYCDINDVGVETQ
ncbi:SH3-domain-containing protein [Melanomma pulvis-pyrius CBS 109.77]|uniref:SH3-domain-containing protein n=1 Tax=Melanomma pulvis-pyrius CBS 109.77 TaxID=1314802 RepID=A0A6A6XUZ5_9PLEO|nr:SH3-domain-containing protein [Melanomma pulvis-pyrius CBS 109.77]